MVTETKPRIRNKLKRCASEIDTKDGKYQAYSVCVDSIYGKKRLKPETYKGVRVTFWKDGQSMITKFIDKKGQKHWLRFPLTKEQTLPIVKKVIDGK